MRFTFSSHEALTGANGVPQKHDILTNRPLRPLSASFLCQKAEFDNYRMFVIDWLVIIICRTPGCCSFRMPTALLPCGSGSKSCGRGTPRPMPNAQFAFGAWRNWAMNCDGPRPICYETAFTNCEPGLAR